MKQAITGSDQALRSGQFGQAAVQEAAFGAVGGEVTRAAVGGTGLAGAAETAQNSARVECRRTGTRRRDC